MNRRNTTHGCFQIQHFEFNKKKKPCSVVRCLEIKQKSNFHYNSKSANTNKLLFTTIKTLYPELNKNLFTFNIGSSEVLGQNRLAISGHWKFLHRIDGVISVTGTDSN